MNVEQSFPIEVLAAPSPRSSILAWVKRRRWFVLFVIVPTVLATLYYGLFASDIYTSESRFVIKSPDEKRSQMSSLANLIQTTGLSGGQEQTNEILDYVRSRDALKALESNISIRERYATDEADFLAGFPQPFAQNTFEDLFRYYEDMISARLDTETGTAVITTKAFTAEDAYRINSELLALSEGMVNRLNTRLQSRGIAEAEKQVDLATERARAARLALGGYRNAQALVDPAQQAVGVIEISNAMIVERAALQAQVETMQRLTPANPSIPALHKRIEAVSAQIASQDRRVVGTDSGIASKIGGYENLLVEQEFATEALAVAQAGLVQARAEAQRQQFYLERVVDPNMPDVPLLPSRLLSIIVVAAASTCLYFVGWMIVVGMLEHAPDE